MSDEKEKELMLKSVEEKAIETVKKEIASFKEGLPQYVKSEDIEQRFGTLKSLLNIH